MSTARSDPRWCRTPGTHELGSAQSAGLAEPRFLIRRRDGLVVQLSWLLQLVVHEVSAEREPAQVAAAVSAAYGQELTVDGLRRLIDEKLEPFGLVKACGEIRATPVAHPDPARLLRLRRTLVPAPVVDRTAGLLAPLFRTSVVLVALAMAATADVLVLGRGGITPALEHVFATPPLLLALIATLACAAVFHECGHAAGCAYGGARPGSIGVGVHLIFPVAYTDVTDSDRLDRSGRLRTALGGLYFNLWFVLALDVAYLGSHQALLLVAVLLLHVEMAQQLVPTVRFDGYFVLAELADVPDLFTRVRPVLVSLVTGTPDARVRALGPAARRTIATWALLVIPLVTLASGWLLYSLPSATIDGIVREEHAAGSAWWSLAAATVLLAALAIVLLRVPLPGLTELGRLMLPHAQATPHEEGTTMLPTENPNPDGLTADALSDDAILGAPRAVPQTGWRRAVLRASGGAFNLGPGAAERRRVELLARVSAPISGTRRVVVMSRKGGVGKTTTTLALGSTYALFRGDRVVAVDANPDAGNLARRATKTCKRTITDLIADSSMISSYSDLRGYTGQVEDSQLEVLASDDDPRIGMALDREAYHRAIDLLDHYYNLILLDTGTGILESANQGLLAEADQLVLVLRPAVDGARAAALTLDWLDEHGYGELVKRAVVVMNGVLDEKPAMIKRIEQHFVRRCATVVTVPWDRALEGGGRTSLSELRPRTLAALTDLAAAVADAFSSGPSVRTGKDPAWELSERAGS